MMLADPSSKYTPYAAIDVGDRQWPHRRITHNPVWLSTDLRDGNQALARPMTADQKLRFFRHLVKCNFKEIEIGYPAASDTEFDFVRRLIDGNEVPDDVSVQVMTPARAELIHRTFDAIAGARHVIISLFNSTAPCFRKVVFRKSKEEIIEMAVHHTKLVRQLALEHRERYGTHFRLAYGVEAFSQTEPEYVVDICTAVKRAWGLAGPGKDRIIYNLPSTVEVAPPNHYADQIEYFCTHMVNRDEIMVSLHCHNDRGTAIAATELGILAGADRVEGCLLGNGERSGNVDLVAVALNMYTQGVPCGLDFSDLPSTASLVSELTALSVHPRHPYAGELIFTAFSGQHQDGIKKGLEARACGGDGRWEVPYLPLDPADVGRTYEAVIRVNSQSGKGGIAYVVRNELGVDLPRSVQQDFYRAVQKRAENTGSELAPGDIVAAFRETYQFSGCGLQPSITLVEFAVSELPKGSDGVIYLGFTCLVCINETTHTINGEGADLGTIFVQELCLRLSVDCRLVEVHTSVTISADGTAERASFALLSVRKEEGLPSLDIWGVGVDANPSRSTVVAVISALNRALGPGGSGAVVTTSKESWRDVLLLLQDDYGILLPDVMRDALARSCDALDHLSTAQKATHFVAHHFYGSSIGKALPSTYSSRVSSFTLNTVEDDLRLEAAVELYGANISLCSTGRDALRCFLAALGDHYASSLRLSDVVIVPPTSRSPSKEAGTGYLSFVCVASPRNGKLEWGISTNEDVTLASLQAALVAAANCGLGIDAPSDSIEL